MNVVASKTRWWLPSSGNWGNFSDQFRMMRRGALSASEGYSQKPVRTPRVLALQRACEFQTLLDSGEVKNRAEIARRCGISRARVTQIMKLLMLPEEIRDHIAGLSEQEQLRYTERLLRGVVSLHSKRAQLKAFEQLRSARQ
jgi:hypothetical protein